ncbi:MAG: peptidoglycan recognition family protein [Candidatus Brocadiales bacterium]
MLSPRVGPVPVFYVVIIALTVGLAAGVPLALLGKKPSDVDVAALCRTEVAKNDWRYIVIHHSATHEGSARTFDDYHRNKRGWKNGLAYHFVIGNGTQTGDGEIEVGRRWKRQLYGAHAGDSYFNRTGIGICLVGNFEEGERPTEKQLESLERLIRYLSRKHDIPLSRVITHKEIRENHTACPGKNFPLDELRYRLSDLDFEDATDAEA